MVFDSLFGKSKKEALGSARVLQFKNAWLLANRSLLAAKLHNEDEDTQIEEASLIEKAKQHLSDQKESFTAEAHESEQLTIKLLPIVDDIYAYANRFINDADVSSAHNTTFQRILELVTNQAASGEAFTSIESPEEFSDKESAMLQRVTKVVTEFWNTTP